MCDEAMSPAPRGAHPSRMTTRQVDARAVLAVLAAVVIWSVALVASQVWRGRLEVAIAAQVDLSVTAAVALYVIAVRRGHLPRWTIPITVAAGLMVGRVVLGMRGVVVVAVVVELAMFGMAIVHARRAVRSWRTTRGAPRLERVDAALQAVGMPVRLARVVATEVTLVTYALTGWRAPVPTPGTFTVHRVNGWPLFAGVLIFLTVVETAVAHVAIAGFVSPTVAWVVSGLSLYSAVWLLGDVLALRHGGVTIRDDGLALALGARCAGHIPWSAIAAIEPRTPSAGEPGLVDASILGGNVVIELRTPCVLLGMFGRRRTATRVALSIDDVERFVAQAAVRELR